MNDALTLQDRKALRMRAVQMLLESIPGEDAGREGLLETPDRVARMYEELFGGYDQDPYKMLSKTFEVEESNDLVLIKDIEFFSHCEHHMVPFHGRVHIAYIPKGRVVGLSKLARVVEVFARRLQIQERLTKQIADIIEEVLDTEGVIVVIEAEHMCMTMRGVQKPGAQTITSALRGLFKEDPAARAEVISLIFGNRND